MTKFETVISTLEEAFTVVKNERDAISRSISKAKSELAELTARKEKYGPLIAEYEEVIAKLKGEA